MKQFLSLILGLSLLVFQSCAGEEASESNNSENDSADTDTSAVVVDSVETETQQQVFTVYGIPDGPENSMYLQGPTDVNDEELPYPDFTELHIIPNPNYNKDEEVDMVVTGMMYGDFELWDKRFRDGEFDVVVYYNPAKSKKMVDYHVINGKADGQVTMYTPEGDVYINRKYENGELVQSFEEPYGRDWTFDQEASALTINDEDNAFTTEEGFTVVNIMPTFNESKENTLETILEKQSYENEFTINGKPFTGFLVGYHEPYDLNPPMRFELAFNEGLLDGDVKIYTYWGDLELHEKFVAGDLDTTIYKLDPENMCGMAKPIIYLYPEEPTKVEVKLAVDGELTTTYPEYNNGWKVLAKPNGTLIDEKGKEYYALYWEGESRKSFTIEDGFVVRGDETLDFLEKSLATLNLNRREANEFIVFWLPHLEKNPYNLIHFSTDEYEEMAQMKITPKPQSLIRVMMVYKPLDKPISISQQNLQDMRVERAGFTVVEWGGHKVQATDQIIY